MTPLQKVAFRGGRISGAVVQCSPELAKLLPGMVGYLAVTPSGRLFDRRRSRIVRGVQVVELPIAQRPQPQTKRRATSGKRTPSTSRTTRSNTG